jgi:uncharacterized protein (TIGR02246 family)
MSLESDVEAIERRRHDWISAVNVRNVDAYLDLLTEDAVWIPPGQLALSGHAAFQAWVQPFFERFFYKFTITDATVRMAGNWAVERATFHSTVTPVSGEPPAQHSGLYLVFWRRETDGLWRIERYFDETSTKPRRLS